MRLLRHVTYVTLGLSSISYADLRSLQDLPSNQINTIGKICEHLTVKRYEEIYAHPRFKVLKNISYTSAKRARSETNAVLGEIDVMVLEEGRIVEIGEVKCANQKNIAKAKKKAINQMNRFLFTCFKQRCSFWYGKSKVDGIQTPLDPYGIKVSFISYRGAKRGFNELDESYKQIAKYHKRRSVSSLRGD